MMVNEGLPLYLVDRLSRRYDLSTMTIGILGMAFKGESDDARSSLAYKLKRILRFKATDVLCADPYVKTDPSLVSQDEVMDRADLLVIGPPSPLRRAVHGQTGGRHLGHQRPGSAGVKPRVSVVSPPARRRGHHRRIGAHR